MEKTVEETQYIIFTKLVITNNFNFIVNKLWENWTFLPKKVVFKQSLFILGIQIHTVFMVFLLKINGFL